MSNKKNIRLSEYEVELILNCLDTSICYLHNCNSRFKLLRMKSYTKIINNGITEILKLSSKFSKLYNKFCPDCVDDIDGYYLIDDFCKLLGETKKVEGS